MQWDKMCNTVYCGLININKKHGCARECAKREYHKNWPQSHFTNPASMKELQLLSFNQRHQY